LGSNTTIQLANDIPEQFCLAEQTMLRTPNARRLQSVKGHSPNALPASFYDRQEFCDKQRCRKPESNGKKKITAERYVGRRRMKRTQCSEKIMSM
jgi:hypothetical protein